MSGSPKPEEMVKSGIKKGSLVNLVLKEGAKFKVGRTDGKEPYNVSVYYMEKNSSEEEGCLATGRMVEIDDEKIRLVQNYNSKLEKNDQEGYVGGTIYYFNTIHSWNFKNPNKG